MSRDVNSFQATKTNQTYIPLTWKDVSFTSISLDGEPEKVGGGGKRNPLAAAPAGSDVGALWLSAMTPLAGHVRRWLKAKAVFREDPGLKARGIRWHVSFIRLFNKHFWALLGPVLGPRAQSRWGDERGNHFPSPMNGKTKSQRKEATVSKSQGHLDTKLYLNPQLRFFAAVPRRRLVQMSHPEWTWQAS